MTSEKRIRSPSLEMKILNWLAQTPATAERLTLLAVTDHALLDMPAEDAAKMQPAELAHRISEQSQAWANGSECRFVARWWRGDEPCLTLQYRTLPRDGETE